MKIKKILILMLILVTLLSVVSAQAMEPRVVATPALYFVGTTVHCSGECSANTMQDDVVIRLVLYENGNAVGEWRASGNGFADINETYPGTSGATYRLTLTYTVNGRTVTPVSVTDTCP